jgi:hypothetical protein
MRNGAGFITRYRITWLLMLAAVVAVTLVLVFSRSVPPVSIEDVKPSVYRANKPEPEYQEERFADLIIDMNELEISLSSSDGSLKVRIWAREAVKNQAGYAIADGVLQFAMEERSTLLLRVQDAVFTLATGEVNVSGSLVGHVTGSDQYFEAQKLSWFQDESLIHTDKVTYRAPSIDVSGERMTLDLETGVVRFEGAVKAGV